MKRPGPAVEKSVRPVEPVQQSFQPYFGVPTGLLARNMQPESAATPGCTTQAELLVLPDLGPIACKVSETKGVKKRPSRLHQCNPLSREASAYQKRIVPSGFPHDPQ